VLVELPNEPTLCKNLIAGQAEAPEGVQYLNVTSPYTGSVIGKVPLSGPKEVTRAVEAAKRAQPEWGATPVKERTQKLFKYRELIERNLERLAHSAAGEAGKTVAEARAGVLKGIEVIEFALSIQNFDTGGTLEVSRGVTCEYRREPLGVVAGVTPFNFPAMVPLWLYPIAVTLGNSFVLKPSEKVPLTPSILGELMVEAGFPAGVFSIVHGGRETVEALLSHTDISAVGFVGSTTAARQVYETGTMRGKRVLALGGAKNHLIVVPDADPAITIPGVVDSFTGCAGQRCMAASAMIAVGNVQDIIDQIVSRASAIEVGPGMGAIIDGLALRRIESAIEEAIQAGAKVLLDGRGKKPNDERYRAGNWIGPTILDGVTPDMAIAGTEVFGPVLSILRAPTLSDALAIENKNPYGNAASVFTTSGYIAEHVASRARAGMIGVNVGVPVPREPFSFGGINDSKFGYGDITGKSSLEFWSLVKKVTKKWAMQKDSNWMSLSPLAVYYQRAALPNLGSSLVI
jgi:malonate-semialdehyde dehydrogenase (acetylating) / methylmalonate-semialdehyde dehydrogenase